MNLELCFTQYDGITLNETRHSERSEESREWIENKESIKD